MGPTTPRRPSKKRKSDTPRKRMPWTDHEVQQLIEGAQTLEPGKWAEILAMFDFQEHRTSVHLKDKWRNLKKQGIVE